MLLSYRAVIQEDNRGTLHCHNPVIVAIMQAHGHNFLIFFSLCKIFGKSTSNFGGVLRGSVANCLTPNPGVLGLSHTGSSGFFVGVSLGKTLQSPSLVLVKPRKA